MKKSPTLLASALLSLSALSPAYANTVEVTITGSIRPAACTPALAGGGLIDYGVIAPSELNAATPTPIGTRSVALTVTCTAPVAWALRAVDQRAASVGANADGLHFGLGKTAADQNIGYYSISLADALADGATVRALRSNDRFATVIEHAGLSSAANWASALALPGVTQPIANQLATANVQIEAFINPAEGLTLTNDAVLDGQATLELIYL